jgi:hypothetical protein
MAQPIPPASSGDSVYEDSSIFKTGNWRERKFSRVGGPNDGDGTFAQGLISDERRPSMLNKGSVVSGGGLFDGGALKSKDEA